MDNFWVFVAIGLLTVGFQALIAAAWMVLGGMGGTWRVNQALARQTDEIHRIDGRITKEVKTRAGSTARQGSSQPKIEEEAAAILAQENGSPAASGARPSVTHLVR